VDDDAVVLRVAWRGNPELDLPGPRARDPQSTPAVPCETTEPSPAHKAAAMTRRRSESGAPTTAYTPGMTRSQESFDTRREMAAGDNPASSACHRADDVELLGSQPEQIRFIAARVSLTDHHGAMKSPGCDGYPAASFSSRSWLRTCGLP
jgi:hypothetical protein